MNARDREDIRHELVRLLERAKACDFPEILLRQMGEGLVEALAGLGAVSEIRNLTNMCLWHERRLS